jgi:hypothetical protein
MQGTRLPALITIILLVVVTAIVIVIVDPVGAPAASVPPSSSVVPSPVADDPRIAELAGTGRGPAFDTTTEDGYPTSDVVQSKLWFHAGSWWGALVAEGTNEYRIHRLDWPSQRWVDTGTAIAPRVGTLPDVVAAGERLYIATGGADPRDRRGVSLLRYTFDPATEQYALDPDFPVRVTSVAAASMSLARDADGRLWVIYLNSGQLYVTRTDGNDLVWREPSIVNVDGLQTDVDSAAMVAFGDAVAIMWSNVVHDNYSFTVATVGAPDQWETRQVAVEGLEYSDDHISLAVLSDADGERIFAAVKTSLDEADGPNRLDPQILLLVREPDGTWRQYLVGRVADHHSRPVVLLDEGSRIVYVVTNSPFSGGGIYMKASSVDRITFPTGLGTELIVDEGAPQVRSATSTKQIVDAASGIVILASDSTTGEYHHAALLAEGGGQAIDRSPFEYPEPGPRRLVNDRFDAFDPGTPVANGWEMRDGGETTFAIIDTDDGRRVAGTVAAPDGSRARMCKQFDPVSDGALRVVTEVFVSDVGESEAVIAAIRHQGVISAALRLSSRGVFSYLDANMVVRTEVPFATDTWYRAVMTLDLAARTYDWEVIRLSDDALVAQAAGIALPDTISLPADEVCLQSPTAAVPGLAFFVDAVLVEH